MALVTTPGAANADSYATIAELEAYLTDRVPVMTLLAGTDAQQEAALRTAARFLDASFQWTGAAVDGTQSLMWPRAGMATRQGFSIGTTVIPTDLKNAQCEFAAQLFAGDRLADNDALKQGITSIKAGPVALTFKDTDESSAESVDILLRRLSPELQWASRMVPDAVRFLIPKSWYLQNSIKRPLMFGAM